MRSPLPPMMIRGRGVLDRVGASRSSRPAGSARPSKGPSSSLHICRQICRVSSSRSKRSPTGGNGTPRPWCSRSYQAAPMPSCGSPAGEHVEGGDDLGQQARVAVGDAGDQQPEVDPLGLAGEEAERGVALEHRVLGGGHPLHLEPVVHQGEQGDAGLVSHPGGLGEGRPQGLGPARQGEVGVVDPELHGVLLGGVAGRFGPTVPEIEAGGKGIAGPGAGEPPTRGRSTHGVGGRVCRWAR